ncbi:hypothetical protein FB567DRAFT_610743 [Paraphoma chrysanthemicola]|uniref:Uncharacterized protein n=1 Tax=Paraphoma chrysanthemicola TaxID=798071 RepID=A0A8K0VUG7_9PLEO|nr:hypothetical protein FB567DRAFT_610743 [Paraphoma chrysanthemicola]
MYPKGSGTHAYATHGAHDGLHYQRQHTLRNQTSPAAAAKVFLLQLWYWRHTKRSFWRTLPWAFLAVLYIGVFAVLAIFSSRVSDGASTSRLILPRDCGVWAVSKDLTDFDRLQTSLEKTAYDVTNAAGTARSCYSSNGTSLSCNTAPVAMLETDTSPVKCPFGNNICFDGKAFEVKTKGIDSRAHLGINARSAERVIYDRQTVCAPLVTKGYGKVVNDSEGVAERVEYHYGYQPFDESKNISTYTYDYLLLRWNANITYHVNIWEDRVAGKTLWKPIEPLSVEGGDTFIIFVEQNSIIHWKQNKDPVFGANQPNDADNTTFRADRYVAPIACIQKYRFCNPNNNQCSPWDGRYQILETMKEGGTNFNAAQIATANRIVLAHLGTSLYEAINARASKCLRAQDKMSWVWQLPLPDNQWEIEVLSWVQLGLAALQTAVQEYAAGPTLELPNTLMQEMKSDTDYSNYTAVDRAIDEGYSAMCHNQIVHDSQGTMNFSLLGIAIIFGLGLLIGILSFTIEPFTAWVQTTLGVGVARANAWQRDDNLQTLRLLFETHQRGAWKGSSDLVPTTMSPDEVFFYPEANTHGLAREVYQSVPSKIDERSA